MIREFDESISSLTKEVECFFKELDRISDDIRNLEKTLTSLRANFSFRYIVQEEQESCPTPVFNHDDYQVFASQVDRELDHFTIQEVFCLAWEPVEKHGNQYRLFLVIVEKHFLIHDSGDGFSKRYWFSRDIYKKPLIETDIYKRSNYAGHLVAFVKKFHEHIRSIRITLLFSGLNESASEENIVPF